jgi:hypothetical protein
MRTSVAAEQIPAPAQAPPAARTAPTATEMYEAARLMQRELRNQRSALDGQRRDLQMQLQRSSNAVVTKGIEARLVALDARQADLDKQQAAADAQVATAAAIPGVVTPPSSSGEEIPPGAIQLGGLGMLMLLLLPLVIAYSRRIWRRGGQPAPAQIPAELVDRMASIERGVEAVAIEVERIGEGQRFVSQLLGDQAMRQSLRPLPVERGRDEIR